MSYSELSYISCLLEAKLSFMEFKSNKSSLLLSQNVPHLLGAFFLFPPFFEGNHR